jgi:thiamine biosynthesis lipoprotein
MQTVALACNAMATRFEIVLHGDDPVALRAAGEEALEEIGRLEAQLSFYRASSELSRLNARAAIAPVRVEPGFFRLLQQAKRLHEETSGAFDITVAPLMRCWGFVNGTGRFPDPEELAAARANVGMHLVDLDANNFTVKFNRDGVMLDLGAIGKGFALERAAELLREVGVSSALLHGGTSTVYALGQPPDAQCWTVAVDNPEVENGLPPVTNTDTKHNLPTGRSALLASIPLKNEALSVSAVWGKSFQVDGETFGHVLDPRTGRPARGALLAAVTLPSATETDALSTALLTLGANNHDQIANLRPGMRTLLVVDSETDKAFRVEARGITVKSPN